MKDLPTRDLTVPNILFVKIHTSGLFRTDLNISDPGQPWMMECAAALCNSTGEMTNFFSHLIKPEGRRAKDGAVSKHGLSDWALSQVGVPEPRVLGILTDMLKTAPMSAMRVVSYNDFDPRIVSSLFARFAVSQTKPATAYDRLWAARPGTEYVTLQHPYCQQLCGLPAEQESELRWPTLEEAEEKILGWTPKPGVRTAWHDLLGVKDLYFACAGRGLFLEAAA